MGKITDNMVDNNKNPQQLHFNTIRGNITEITKGERFSHFTIEVGHESKRSINLVLRAESYDWFVSNFKVGDRVSVRYYLTSRQKMGKWHTMATTIDVNLADDRFVGQAS